MLNMMQSQVQTPMQMQGWTQMQPQVQAPIQAQKSSTHAISSENVSATSRQAWRNVYCMQFMQLQEYLNAFP